MNPTTTRLPAAVALLVALMVPAYAQNAPRPIRQPVVAHVDLEKVFNEINALEQAQARIEQALVPSREQADQLKARAERLREDLDLYAPGTEKYKQAEKEWTRAVIDYQAMVSFIDAKLDALRAEARAGLFREITDSAVKFAQARGIDYIITSDSGIPLLEGKDVQVVQQLALRRVVYASPELDVTTGLIAWINAP